MKNQSTLTIQTSWGPIRVFAEAGKIVSCLLPFVSKMPKATVRIKKSEIKAYARADRSVLKKANAFVEGLLCGKRKPMPKLALPESSDFIGQCWKAMMRVPLGTTISYRELARKAGRPRAARAAGSACASNEIPLFIPCHRILASNGRLGGFSSGLPWKVFLLESESSLEGRASARPLGHAEAWPSKNRRGPGSF